MSAIGEKLANLDRVVASLEECTQAGDSGVGGKITGVGAVASDGALSHIDGWRFSIS